MSTEQNLWKETIINALVVSHIYCKEHETDPGKALHELLNWEIGLALNPQVSSYANDLIELGREQERKKDHTYPPRLLREYIVKRKHETLRVRVSVDKVVEPVEE